MSERLILRLPEGIFAEETAEYAVHWVILMANGEVKQQGDRLAAGSAAELVRGRQVIALAPGSAVSLHRVTPPAGSRRNLQQALPYLLEEDLAGDVDTLHFALGPVLDGDQSVAVVAREQMACWQQMLQTLGVKTRYLVPDILLVPVPEQSEQSKETEDAGSDSAVADCQVMALGDDWLIRQGAWQAALLESSWAEAWSQWQQVSFDHPEPQSVSQGLAQLAQQLPAAPFTLLQGDFRPTQAMGRQWRQWRLAAGFMVTALVLQLVLSYQQISQLEQTSAAYRQASEQIYRDLFGAKSRIVNLQAQMRQKIQSLEQGSEQESGGFLELMLSLTPTLSQGDALTVKGIKYEARRNELRLDAQSDDFDGFQQFASKLEQPDTAGGQLSVDQGALKRDKQGKISGTLTIRDVR